MLTDPPPALFREPVGGPHPELLERGGLLEDVPSTIAAAVSVIEGLTILIDEDFIFRFGINFGDTLEPLSQNALMKLIFTDAG